MADFLPAIRKVLKNEGGFVQHARDPGGATNFGVSIRYLKDRGDMNGDGLLDGDLDGDGDINVDDIRNMSQEQAVELYRTGFWEPNNYAALPQSIADKALDMAVNMGPRQGNKIIQRALKALRCTVVDDGDLGAASQAAIRTVLARDGEQPLLACIRATQEGFYRQLAAAHPDLRVFLQGWINRAHV